MNTDVNTHLSSVYLVNCQGVGPICLQQTKSMFERLVENPVEEISLDELHQKELKPGTIVMPGGNGAEQAMSFIQRNLAPIRPGLSREEEIRRYNTNFKLAKVAVREFFNKKFAEGHNFLGICAGGYFATKSYIDLVGSFTNQSDQKMRFRQVKTTEELNEKLIDAPVFYFGGPEFRNLEENIKILAHFEDSGAAIIEKINDKSRIILSSHHIEANKNFPYRNFLAYMHESTSEQQMAESFDAFQAQNDKVTILCLERLGLKIKHEQALNAN